MAGMKNLTKSSAAIRKFLDPGTATLDTISQVVLTGALGASDALCLLETARHCSCKFAAFFFLSRSARKPVGLDDLSRSSAGVTYEDQKS